jgi:hypothetical protein
MWFPNAGRHARCRNACSRMGDKCQPWPCNRKPWWAVLGVRFPISTHRLPEGTDLTPAETPSYIFWTVWTCVDPCVDCLSRIPGTRAWVYPGQGGWETTILPGGKERACVCLCKPVYTLCWESREDCVQLLKSPIHPPILLQRICVNSLRKLLLTQFRKSTPWDLAAIAELVWEVWVCIPGWL